MRRELQPLVKYNVTPEDCCSGKICIVIMYSRGSRFVSNLHRLKSSTLGAVAVGHSKYNFTKRFFFAVSSRSTVICPGNYLCSCIA